MSRTRKNYPASFKTKVVIAALRDDRPTSELASQFGVHSTVIGPRTICQEPHTRIHLSTIRSVSSMNSERNSG